MACTIRIATLHSIPRAKKISLGSGHWQWPANAKGSRFEIKDPTTATIVAYQIVRRDSDKVVTVESASKRPTGSSQAEESIIGKNWKLILTGDIVDPGVDLPTPRALLINFTSDMALRVKGSVSGVGSEKIFLEAGDVTLSGSAQFAYTKRDGVKVQKPLTTAGTSPTYLQNTTLTTMALTVDNVNLKVTGVTASGGLTVSGELALAKVVDDPTSTTTTYTAFHMGNVSISGELDPGLIAGLGLSANIFLTTYDSNSVSPNTMKRLDWARAFDLDGDGIYGGISDIVDPGADLPGPRARCRSTSPRR